VAVALDDAAAAPLGARREASISMRCTLSSSISAPRLFSALAIADSSTLRTIPAPFLGMNFSVARALPTALPRTVSATRRHFCGEMRA
jgi:hypothetical protein